MDWFTQLVEWIRNNRRKSIAVVVFGVLVGTIAFVTSNVFGALDAIANEEFEPGIAAEDLDLTRGDDLAPDDDETQTEDDLRSEQALLLERQLSELEMLEDLRLDRLGRNEPPPVPFELATATSPVLPDDMFTSVLLIGSDASGALADVIIDVLLPSDGSTPILASIPRDTFLKDFCRGGYRRVNENLGGCRGVASGPELLALAVGEFTGIEVDHFARVNFSGFERIVDRTGGLDVCVGEYPIRDVKSGLDLPPGCQTVGGEQALAWVRSRNPQVFRDGEWVTSPGSDFDRQAKERDALFQLGRKLAEYSSVGALTGALGGLSDAVTLDSGWSVSEIASLAFRYRGVDPSSAHVVSIPLRDYRTSYGAQVLLPRETFNTALARVYPPAAR